MKNLEAAEEGTPRTQEETPRTQEEEAPSTHNDSIVSVDSDFHSGKYFLLPFKDGPAMHRDLEPSIRDKDIEYERRNMTEYEWKQYAIREQRVLLAWEAVRNASLRKVLAMFAGRIDPLRPEFGEALDTQERLDPLPEVDQETKDAMNDRMTPR